MMYASRLSRPLAQSMTRGKSSLPARALQALRGSTKSADAGNKVKAPIVNNDKVKAAFKGDSSTKSTKVRGVHSSLLHPNTTNPTQT